MIGRDLSHFRITAKIGEGGMGEVYRATDSKLGREVAIKVLPEAVAGSPERLARFEREAKVLASLNHNNIAAIFSLETAEPSGAGEGLRSLPVHFLVMELVEGEDLAERIDRGPVPVVEARRIAGEIARGLEAAHQKGVIHRDLKPANIKVTPEGQVKILDFGLAKALDTSVSGADNESAAIAVSASPTLTAEMTQAGVVLGTAAYMSPEQAKGHDVDYQTDIWAFGCVLYEMLTGQPPFVGESFAELSAAILDRDPDWDALPRSTPAATRQVVQRCLSKDKSQRLHHIGDARLDLEMEDAPVSAGETSPTSPWPRLLMATAVGAALTLGIVLLTDGESRSAGVAPNMTVSLVAPSGHHISGGLSGQQSFAISPGGERIVYVATDPAGDSAIWLHSLASGEAQAVAGTDDAFLPFWSPEGQSVGFFRPQESEDGETEPKLWRVDPGAGPPALIGRIPPYGYRGGAWSTDDQILIGTGWHALYQVSASGGTPSPVTELQPEDQSHRWPHWLPDGEHFLFTVMSNSSDRVGIYLGSVHEGEVRRLTESFSSAIWIEPGYLLFVRDGNLVGRPFDARRLEFTGEIELLAPGVQLTRFRRGVFSLSETGLLAYGTGSEGRQLTWRSRAGQVLGTLGPVADFHDLRISPDGSQVVYARIDGSMDLWLHETERDSSRRLTDTPEGETYPVWSPDQQSILFSLLPQSGGGMLSSSYRLDLADPRSPQLIAESFSTHDWSRDGSSLILGTEGSIQSFPVGGGEPTSLVESGFVPEGYQFKSRLSPDGQWLAFASQETGSPQVFVKHLDTGRIVRISTGDGGFRPEWAPDGREIYYLSIDGMLMSVGFDPDDPNRTGEPESLFAVNGDSFDVAPDGERFLINQIDLEAVSPPVTIVTNWQRLLDR